MDSVQIQLLSDLGLHSFDTIMTIDTVINFTTQDRFRIHFGEHVTNAAFEFTDFSGSYHTIKSLTIGWKPWDDQNDF